MKSYILLVLCASLSLLKADQCNTFLNCVSDIKNCTYTDQCFGKTYFSLRPQDSNSARRLLKIAQEKGHTKHNDLAFWGFDFSLGMQHSFSRKNNSLDKSFLLGTQHCCLNKKNVLGKWFLFNCTPCITVGIPTQSSSFDVDGRQLGLMNADTALGATGSLSLDPSIKNIIADFSMWFDLNNLLRGFWVRTDLTIVRTKTHLNICSSSPNSAQSGNYAAGDYTLTCTPSPLAYTSIQDAFIGDNSIGVIPPLHYGKFYCDSLSKTAVASMRFDIGFDFVKDYSGFFNVSTCVVAPTGTRPNGRHILEPVVGANKSWQIGGVISGAYHFDSHISLYSDITFTHLFKALQTRVFSLVNGPGSQYLLLKEFDLNVGAVVAADRVANILAGEAKIGAAIMFDSSLMMHYIKNQFFMDFGYNFWIRSRETIGDKICFRNFAKNTYGIKGDTLLSQIDSFSGLCIGNLNTQSNSTIAKPGDTDDETVLLDVCNIDFNAALHPAAFSNKIFGAFGYTKEFERLYTMLHIAFQWQLEFGQKDKAIDQWGIGFNIGSSF